MSLNFPVGTVSQRIIFKDADGELITSAVAFHHPLSSTYSGNELGQFEIKNTRMFFVMRDLRAKIAQGNLIHIGSESWEITGYKQFFSHSEITGLKVVTIPDMVISSGTTTSNVLKPDDLKQATTLLIIAPSALTGTVDFQISDDNTTWATLTDEGADVTLPAGKAKQVTINERSYVRLLSSASEGSDRTFKILRQQA
jgi:hypothetical protein